MLVHQEYGCERIYGEYKQNIGTNNNTNINRHRQDHLNENDTHIIRLVVISDTHNRHKAMTKLLPPPPPDASSSILIHCGDFADRGNRLHVRSFCRWLSRVPSSKQNERDENYELPGLPRHYRHVIVVNGNHDVARPPAPEIDLRAEFRKCNQVLQTRGIDRQVYFLDDQCVTLPNEGLTLCGTSWESSVRGNYERAFATNKDDGCGGARAPDVMISHLVPYFSAHHRKQIKPLHHDDAIDFRAWVGSRELLSAATQRQVPLVLSGHVHWGRGAVFLPRQEEINNLNNDGQDHPPFTGTWFVNAASTKPGIGSVSGHSDQSREVTAPVVIDYDVRNRRVVHLSCPKHRS